MLDLDHLTDEQLLNELLATDDPDELLALRAAAAQRGLHQSASSIPLREKREIHDAGGGKL